MWRLPDGSVLRLNTDSTVTVHYSARERAIDLDRGEALFQVAHDSVRRLRVAVGDTNVVAVGTQFDVYAHAGVTDLTVIEGTVAVSRGNQQPATPGNGVSDSARRIEAGYRLHIQAGHTTSIAET